MKYRSSSGLTTVELIVTLVVAMIFLIAGFQLYGLLSDTTGDNNRATIANNTVSEYIEEYQSYATNPCTEQSILIDSPMDVDGITGATITVSIDCPYSDNTSLSKLIASISYDDVDDPSNLITLTNSMYVNSDCPDGFIKVPGSSTYGTDDFCVMKYDAKNNGNDQPVSTTSGTPWVNIDQIEAITRSKNTVDCDNCHLITEAEWMTIAQNVLSVGSNWSGGSVGNGYIYSGHNDGDPASPIIASSDDSDGYYGTNNSNGNQRRTLTLTNGEVIWDFAGNVWNWTSGTTTGDTQPGVDGGGAAWREFTDLTNSGNLVVNPMPVGTDITSASSWTSSNGIGEIYSSSDENIERSFVRGGTFGMTSRTGILALHTRLSSTYTSDTVGFRVVKPLY